MASHCLVFYCGDSVETILSSYLRKNCHDRLRGAFQRAAVLRSIHARVEAVNWPPCQNCVLCSECQNGFIWTQSWVNVQLENTPEKHLSGGAFGWKRDVFWSRVESSHHLLGPGWSWFSPQRAGSTAIRWAGAGRGGAWRAPSARPSRGRSEKTGHDSATQSPSQYSQNPAFKSQQAWWQNKICNGFNRILNLMKSTTDCKACEICSRWQ